MKLLGLLCVAMIAASWNYDSQNSWGDSCSTPNQSPVDIVTSDASLTDDSTAMKMVLLGQTGSKTVEHTGNYLRVKGYFGYIEFGTGDSMRAFDAREVDFHVPSEHTIDGVTFPMEMQVVLYAQDKYILRHDANIAFMGVIFKHGIESYFMNTLQAWQFPQLPGGVTILANTSNINVREVVWDTDDYYYYNGTATNPDFDCQSPALWFIIKDIKEAAEWQVQAIRNIFPKNNSRPVLDDWSPDLYYSGQGVVALAGVGVLLAVCG